MLRLSSGASFEAIRKWKSFQKVLLQHLLGFQYFFAACLHATVMLMFVLVGFRRFHHRFSQFFFSRFTESCHCKIMILNFLLQFGRSMIDGWHCSGGGGHFRGFSFGWLFGSTFHVCFRCIVIAVRFDIR